MDSAREGIFARGAEALAEVEVGDVVLVVDDIDLDARVGELAGIVRADVRRDTGMGGVDLTVASLDVPHVGLGVPFDRRLRHPRKDSCGSPCGDVTSEATLELVLGGA